jgi:hypothetical protein
VAVDLVIGCMGLQGKETGRGADRGSELSHGGDSEVLGFGVGFWGQWNCTLRTFVEFSRNEACCQVSLTAGARLLSEMAFCPTDEVGARACFARYIFVLAPI